MSTEVKKKKYTTKERVALTRKLVALCNEGWSVDEAMEILIAGHNTKVTGEPMNSTYCQGMLYTWRKEGRTPPLRDGVLVRPGGSVLFTRKYNRPVSGRSHAVTQVGDSQWPFIRLVKIMMAVVSLIGFIALGGAVIITIGAH